MVEHVPTSSLSKVGEISTPSRITNHYSSSSEFPTLQSVHGSTGVNWLQLLAIGLSITQSALICRHLQLLLGGCNQIQELTPGFAAPGSSHHLWKVTDTGIIAPVPPLVDVAMDHEMVT